MFNTRRIPRLVSTLVGLIALTAAVGCKKPAVVEDGKLVKIDYTLNVDGAVIDSSQGKPPLAYVQGAHQIIPGLEAELAGAKVGDKKHVVISPEKGYGPIDPKAEQKIPKSVFGDTSKLTVGMMVTGQSGGRPVRAKVLAIGKKDVTLDFNHPLAGKTLTFDVEVKEITKAPDMPAGMPMGAPPVPTNEMK